MKAGGGNTFAAKPGIRFPALRFPSVVPTGLWGKTRRCPSDESLGYFHMPPSGAGLGQCFRSKDFTDRLGSPSYIGKGRSTVVKLGLRLRQLGGRDNLNRPGDSLR
jgi:hypothetical protein